MAVDGRSDLYAPGDPLLRDAHRRAAVRGIAVRGGGAADVGPRARPRRAGRPRCRVPFQAVIRRCLERSPARRYQSAHELIADLDRPGGPRRRAPSLRWAVAGAAVVLAVLAGWWLVGQRARAPAAEPGVTRRGRRAPRGRRVASGRRDRRPRAGLGRHRGRGDAGRAPRGEPGPAGGRDHAAPAHAARPPDRPRRATSARCAASESCWESTRWSRGACAARAGRCGSTFARWPAARPAWPRVGRWARRARAGRAVPHGRRPGRTAPAGAERRAPSRRRRARARDGFARSGHAPIARGATACWWATRSARRPPWSAAVAADPQFAAAWEGLSGVYQQLGYQDKALAAAKQAAASCCAPPAPAWPTA